MLRIIYANNLMHMGVTNSLCVRDSFLSCHITISKVNLAYSNPAELDLSLVLLFTKIFNYIFIHNTAPISSIHHHYKFYKVT